MLYFLHGQNSFLAFKKIKEIKASFLKNNPGFLIHDIDGEEDISDEFFYGLIQNSGLFSGKRLFVLKNALLLPFFESFLEENALNLKNSKNIFVLWEKDIKKNSKNFSFLEKNAEKTQEVKSKEIAENSTQRNEIFRVVDQIFFHKGSKVVCALENARKLGIAPKDLINVIFWNFKRKIRISIREAGLAYEAILADLNLKVDSKNERENLERLALSISKV